MPDKKAQEYDGLDEKDSELANVCREAGMYFQKTIQNKYKGRFDIRIRLE